ncbi:uncharacterized protein J4E78_002014 [Alternaria triticimaculans]|uniref:uncharacterized protein n=1 Tax=Alternaria triticimaculans TaxID=297637 RepID=UPI0020C438E8|nr:uncharacterized protein J4E78_002014 [Alternaria triticimaculans]KAI4668190.1 hypothetical protein J4E78_002014 [Alternaria triticimaculans]
MTITAENNLEYPQGQLFVHAIEEKAQWIPNNMYMRYAPDDWLHRGYKTITWKQYASAIDKMAFWFDERLGKAVDRETVAYFGPNDPRMVPLDAGSDDLHELILEQVGDGRTNPFQTSFWNPGHRFLGRIETKELYRPVKDSDGRTRWAFSARKDDLTKLSWLAKFHAQDIERRILQHPDVQNVLVGGEARPAPYVIAQAKEGVLDGKSEAQLLEELYNGVVAATNKTDMDEIRIPRETVMIAKKEKPLKVSLKQLVQRKAVEQDYSEEIEQAYVQLENSRKP